MSFIVDFPAKNQTGSCNGFGKTYLEVVQRRLLLLTLSCERFEKLLKVCDSRAELCAGEACAGALEPCIGQLVPECRAIL